MDRRLIGDEIFRPLMVVNEPRVYARSRFEDDASFATRRDFYSDYEDRWLKPGSSVILHGLSAKPELNGQSGKVVAGAAMGRVGVQLGHGRQVSVKLDSLKPAGEAGEAWYPDVVHCMTALQKPNRLEGRQGGGMNDFMFDSAVDASRWQAAVALMNMQFAAAGGEEDEDGKDLGERFVCDAGTFCVDEVLVTAVDKHVQGLPGEQDPRNDNFLGCVGSLFHNWIALARQRKAVAADALQRFRELMGLLSGTGQLSDRLSGLDHEQTAPLLRSFGEVDRMVFVGLVLDVALRPWKKNFFQVDGQEIKQPGWKDIIIVYVLMQRIARLGLDNVLTEMQEKRLFELLKQEFPSFCRGFAAIFESISWARTEASMMNHGLIDFVGDEDNEEYLSNEDRERFASRKLGSAGYR